MQVAMAVVNGKGEVGTGTDNVASSVAACKPARPMTQSEFRDSVETHHSLVSAKNGELGKLNKTMQNIRDNKGALGKVRDSLQEEINAVNQGIHTKSEEIMHLKNKLRYHSERQINENIERLEYQLRNNNYKPKEEQKILDEISMLRRSIRTLRDYEVKQDENKKLRDERSRLIVQRNGNYAKMRTLMTQEEESRRGIGDAKEIIAANRHALDQLRQLRPQLEILWQEEQAARKRIQEEKTKVQREERRQRQEEKKRLWEEYEASREPFEEERNLCHILISYLATFPISPKMDVADYNDNAAANSNPVSVVGETDGALVGTFYSKPKQTGAGEECIGIAGTGGVGSRQKKRERDKRKRVQRLMTKPRELSHAPDTLAQFQRLKLTVPRTSDEVAAASCALQSELERYEELARLQLTEGSTGKCDSAKMALNGTLLSLTGESLPFTNTDDTVADVENSANVMSPSTTSDIQIIESPLENVEPQNIVPINGKLHCCKPDSIINNFEITNLCNPTFPEVDSCLKSKCTGAIKGNIVNGGFCVALPYVNSDAISNKEPSKSYASAARV